MKQKCIVFKEKGGKNFRNNIHIYRNSVGGRTGIYILFTLQKMPL